MFKHAQLIVKQMLKCQRRSLELLKVATIFCAFSVAAITTASAQWGSQGGGGSPGSYVTFGTEAAEAGMEALAVIQAGHLDAPSQLSVWLLEFTNTIPHELPIGKAVVMAHRVDMAPQGVTDQAVDSLLLTKAFPTFR